MDDPDREWQQPPGSADDETDRLEDEDYHEAPTDDTTAAGDPAAADSSGRGGIRGHRDNLSEQDKWRRLAWAGLIGAGVGGVVILALTVFVLREQGENADKLLRLVEKGQQQRADTAGQISQGTEERQAAVENLQAESQSFRAQQQAALADQAQSNAEARQAFAEGNRANAEANQADRQAALADAQAEQADRQAAALDTIAATQDELITAIKKLKKSIDNLGPGP